MFYFAVTYYTNMQLCGIKLMNLRLKEALTCSFLFLLGQEEGYISLFSGESLALLWIAVAVLRCFMVESLPVFVDQYLSVCMLKNYPFPIMHICALFLSPHSELIKKAFILTHEENNIKLSIILRILLQLPYNLNTQSITNEITWRETFYTVTAKPLISIFYYFIEDGKL